MISILKSDSVKVILAIAAVLILCGVIVPLIIKGFFLVLLAAMTHPLSAVIASVAFLLGMFINEKLK